MVITQPIPTETHSKDDSINMTQSQTHSDSDDMIFTQPIPKNIYSDDESAIQRSPIRRPLRSPIRRPLKSPIRTPQASPLRSTFRIPQASPIRTPQASPIRPPQRSPIRTLLRSPLRASLGTPPGEPSYASQNISLGTPLRTSARNSVTSPARSTIRTPQRTSTSSNTHLRPTTRPPSASPRSFYLHSGQSIEADPLLGEVEEMLDHYDSQNDITVEKPKMSLSSFLSLAGITFPTYNLENTEIAYRDLSFDVPESESEQIVSTATLPEIHLYQKACQQLIASIKRSDETIENIDETVSKVNPQLFTEYMEGTAQTQLNIQEQLKDIKNYSMHRSKQEWLTLFTEALRDFPTSLKDMRDRLQTYRELEQYVGDKLVEIKAYSTKMSEIFHHYRQKEQEYQMVDRDRLNILLSEIQVQKEVYQDLKKSADSLEENVQKLKDEDQALESEIQELNYLLKEIEETMEQNQCITMDDFKNAKMEYDQFSKMFGWKVREMNDTILHLEIDIGVDIITDLQKLNRHHSNAVVCRISSAREERLGPLAELMNAFSVAVKNVWNKHEVNQEVAIYWNKIRLIEREIDLLKRRWWVKMQTLEHNGDLNNAGFSLEICLFNFEGKSKFNITFEYRAKDMKKFPELDLSTLKLKVFYGGLDHDTVKSLIIEELSNDGILGLEKVLQSVLQKTLVTSPREV
ncbi:Spc7 kinetochore protein-domain-containing protein [Pilaira anomala]|nr:Spc7 kinetochore protein-domain-containing protein [Pilaira anomala]